MSSYNSLNAGTGTHSPYGSGDPYYNESTGYITPQPPVKKSGVSNWIKIGVPVLIVVIVGAVLGGVLGSRKSNNASSSSAGQANASSAVSIKNEIGRYATATNSLYLVPLYPSTVSALASTCFLPVDGQARRRTRRHSQRRLSLHPVTLNLHGRKILSNHQVLTFLQPARTGLVLWLLRINGKLCRTSSNPILTSGDGTTPFSAMRPSITIFLPLYILWMATAGSSTIRAMSR